MKLSWQVFSDGRKHIAAHCRTCLRWIRWMPQTFENMVKANFTSGTP